MGGHIRKDKITIKQKGAAQAPQLKPPTSVKMNLLPATRAMVQQRYPWMKMKKLEPTKVQEEAPAPPKPRPKPKTAEEEAAWLEEVKKDFSKLDKPKGTKRSRKRKPPEGKPWPRRTRTKKQERLRKQRQRENWLPHQWEKHNKKSKELKAARAKKQKEEGKKMQTPKERKAAEARKKLLAKTAAAKKERQAAWKKHSEPCRVNKRILQMR